MIKQRIGTAISVVALAAVLLAGCGDASQKVATKDGATSARSRVAAAGQASVAKESARYTMTSSMDGKGAPSADDLSSMGMNPVTGEFDGTTSHMTMSIAGMKMEIITTPEATYEKATVLGDGWFKIENGAAAAAAVAQPISNLSSYLLALADGSGVKDIGQTEIGGRQLHGYSATIDLTGKAGAASDKVTSEAGKAAIAKMQKTMSMVPIKVWIDDQTGLVARLVISLEAAGARINETMDFTDYGSAVNIVVPTDAKEISLDELMKMAMAAGTKSN